MKRNFHSKSTDLILSLFIMLSGFILISCSNGLQDGSEKKSEETAEIQVNLNSSDVRSVIPLSEISNINLTYEMIVYNSEKHYSETFKSGTTLKMAVEKGTWNVLILAGKTGYFCGSGYYDNLVLDEIKTSEISIDLYPVDVSISAPESVFCNTEYEVTFSGNTRNPHLVFSSVNIKTSSSKKISFDVLSQEVSGTITLTSSSEACDSVIKIGTSDIYLVCDDFTKEEKLETFATLDNIAGEALIKKENFTFCNIKIVEDTTIPGIQADLNWCE